MSDTVVVVAAHPDDEVLGCGGTLAKHAQAGDDVHVIFLADGVGSRGVEAHGDRDAREDAARQSCEILGLNPPQFLRFCDNRMDELPLLEVIQPLEKLLDKIGPYVVYTHHGGDLNIDHRVTYQAVMTACRPLPDSRINTIFTFEVLSSTEWAVGVSTQFRPTRAVDISDQAGIKLDALKCYQAELRDFPHPRSIEAVVCLSKTRGAQFGLDAAEVFAVERDFWR